MEIVVKGTGIMKTGASQIEITPKPGVELQGFAVRPQPSQSVGDSLMVRALYLQKENEPPFVWLVFDLLGLEESIVLKIRAKIEKTTQIPANNILISSTHTHSGPGTTHLFRCGNYCEEYAQQLPDWALQASQQAIENQENCQPFFAEASSFIGRDRHTGPERKIDPRIPILFWKKTDGSDEIKAVLLSYSMHPVCMKDNIISADWPGEVSRQLFQHLNGNPVTLVLSGACGNIDPPSCGVSYDLMKQWSQEISQSVLKTLTDSTKIYRKNEQFSLHTQEFIASIYDQTKEDVLEFVRQTVEEGSGSRSFGEIYCSAAAYWKEKMLLRIDQGTLPTIPIRFSILKIDDLAFISVNVEIFCHLTQLVQEKITSNSHQSTPNSSLIRSVYVLGNSDSAIGYLGVRSAYEAHSYEVDESSLFYGQPRFRIGTLEELADIMTKIVINLQ